MRVIKHYLETVRKTGIVYWVGSLFRKYCRNPIERARLSNRDFSIISQNCIGGIMSHDLGQRFNSPTVNLYFSSEDFVIFLENLRCFIDSGNLIMVQSDKRYPKAELSLHNGPKVSLYFPHDNNEEVILTNWRKRAERLDYDNLFIIATDRDGLTEDLLNRYAHLPYKNLVLLSSKPHPQYPFVIYYPQYKELDQVTDMLKIITVFGKREYQQGWDYINWLNNGSQHK